MKNVEDLGKIIERNKQIVFYTVAGILSLTLAFGLGQCSAPVDRQTLCKTYIDDVGTLQGQLETCRREKVVDCDERISQCHEQERAACQESLDLFRSRCEDLACQER